MKLSEAMRNGARKWPEARNLYIDQVDGSCCAMGAAYREVTGRSRVDYSGFGGSLNAARLAFKSAFPILGKVITPPAGSTYTTELEMFDIINVLHHNDGWSREAIAEWVETVERRIELEDASVEQERPACAGGGHGPEGATSDAGEVGRETVQACH